MDFNWVAEMRMRDKENAIKAKALCEALKKDERLTDILSIDDLPDNTWNFHVKFKKSGGVNVLSIAVPQNVHNTHYFETALLNDDKSDIIYNADYGYSDVRKFDTTEEIIEELIRPNTNPILNKANLPDPQLEASSTLPSPDSLEDKDKIIKLDWNYLSPNPNQYRSSDLQVQVADLMKRVAAIEAVLKIR
jgi:hypothetical protein